MVLSAPSLTLLAIHVWYRRLWHYESISMFIDYFHNPFMIPGFTRPAVPLQGVVRGRQGRCYLETIFHLFPRWLPLPQDPGVSHFKRVSGCPLIGQMITIDASDWPSFVLIIWQQLPNHQDSRCLLKSPLTSLVIAITHKIVSLDLIQVTFKISPKYFRSHFTNKTKYFKLCLSYEVSSARPKRDLRET